MYYRHFGHISFYHPLLLSFFLDHAGFADTEIGANPNTKSPLMPELQRIADTVDRQTASPTISYRPEIAPQGSSLLNRWSYHLKRRLSRWLVQPFLDDLVLSANQEIEILRAEQSAELSALSSHSTAPSSASLSGVNVCRYRTARVQILHLPHE